VAVKVSRGGTRARRNQYQDYNDYMDYYRQQSRTHQPAVSHDSTRAPPLVWIRCYSCFYELKNNDWKGKKNCAEPFSPLNIPIVNCSGSCGVISIIHDECHF